MPNFIRLAIVAFTVAFLALSPVATAQSTKMKDVPFGVSSFGGVSIGDQIYLYGGHTGPAHSYTLDGISGKLLVLDTSKPDAEWKHISDGPALQGLALVAHGDKLYRIGGLTLKPSASKQSGNSDNHQDKEDIDTEAGETAVESGVQLESLASVACFDPKKNKWSDLPALPEPRSSHDAVILDDTIFVVGGWTLDGAEGDEEWLETAYKMNLATKPLAWEKIAAPDAARRAHSLAAFDGKVFMIGGMDDAGSVLNDVATYDIANNEWETATSIPSEHRFASFGNSAFAVGDVVYCLGIDGTLRSLDAPDAKWQTVAQTEARFFHRLVRLGSSVGIIGGSNMQTGFTNETLVFSTAADSSTAKSSSEGELAVQLGQLKSATSSEYDSMIKSMTDGGVDVESVVKTIRAGVAPQPKSERTEKLKAGWTEWEATDTAGVTRPYQLFLPESVAKGTSPAALIVHIHGAVGKPDFGKGAGNPSAVGYAPFLWPKVAEKNDYVVVCPVGRSECSWWTDNGVSHMNAVLRDVRRSISVPDQSIFASGFSDGGSGCYYLAMAVPGPFAGFYAMNGHPRVAASASGKQLYLRNMTATPLISAMTQEDSLYPSKNVLPHITKAIAAGAPITVISYPNANHQPLYFDDQTSTIVNFFKKTKRADDRTNIRWQTADSKTAAVAWAEIMKMGSTKTDEPELEEINIMSNPGRVSLGVQLEGNKFSTVVDDSVAIAVGYKVGDELVSFDGAKIVGTGELRNALKNKTYGDSFTSVIQRGGEEMTIKGQFPTFTPEPVYKRGNPAAYIDCTINIEEASISLTSRRVQKLRVWLPDELADKETIKLDWSGTTSQLKVQRLSTSELLERFAKNADAKQRVAYVDIED